MRLPLDAERLRRFMRGHFEAIEPLLYRFPAIDPAAFRVALDAALAPASPEALIGAE